MSVESLTGLLTGGVSAVAVMAIFLALILAGKLHTDGEFGRLEAENAQLRAEAGQYKTALDTERRAVNETAQAGQVTNQLITALTAIAGERRAPAPPVTPPVPPPPGITAGDPAP